MSWTQRCSHLKKSGTVTVPTSKFINLWLHIEPSMEEADLEMGPKFGRDCNVEFLLNKNALKLFQYMCQAVNHRCDGNQSST